MDKKFFTISQVAEKLGYSKKTIFRMLAAGVIKTERNGAHGHHRVSESALNQYHEHAAKCAEKAMIFRELAAAKKRKARLHAEDAA